MRHTPNKYLIPLITTLLITACGDNGTSTSSSSSSSSSSTSTSSSSSASSSTSSSSSSGYVDTRPIPTGPGVDVGSPNANGQTPAFTLQTRAPAMSSPDLARTTVASTLRSPWGMTFLPDGNMLITEKAGTLRLVTQSGNISTVSGIPQVYTAGQGGLMDVALDPDFENNRWVYFSYSEPRPNDKNGTTVARGKLSASLDRLDDVEVIFEQFPGWKSSLHFGSRLIFDNDGLLYIALGERSLPEPRIQAQDPGSHLGKVIRIHADGSVPTSNPFNNGGGAVEVWSYGHRNIQGTDIHPDTGALWTMEHGPRGGDEINIPLAGKNYGWPIITYGIDYSGRPIGDGITKKEGMEQPVYYFDPVIAPGDITFYTGSLFKEWRGDLLLTALNSVGRNAPLGALIRLRVDGEKIIGEQRYLSDIRRLRDVEVGPNGAIWVITDERNTGKLIKLTPSK